MTSNLQTLLFLRAVVAALGERATPPWWRTTMLTDVGLRICGRVFPRTALQAALKSVTLFAQHDHDERVGANRYHLFRLPAQGERALWSDLLQGSGPAEIGALLNGDRQVLLDRLELIAGAQKVEAAEGPIRMGTADELENPDAIARCAAHYLASTAHAARRFPYFEPAEAGR